MGFYSQVIFPRLCDFFLSKPFVTQYRQELLAAAAGNILEIGFGSGLNLSCYPQHVRKLTTVDPNPGMNRLAQKRIGQSAIEIDQRVGSSEQMPFENGAFDCVVSTFTLCSIDNPGQALSEVYRVLKPRGRFLFLEHGISPEPSVQKWQSRLNWLEMQLGDGCRLNRKIKELVSAQSFSFVECIESYMSNVPKTHGYLYRGKAAK